MNLAVRIQHHGSRAHLLPDLVASLRGLPDPVVVTDPGGRQRSTWRCHRLCLESCPDDATALLVLQDDAVPCDQFADAVTAAVAEQPDRIIALFVPGVGHLARTVNIARMKGQRWLDWPAISFVPLVGVVYPADIARAIPKFADAKRISVGRADDAVVSQYVRAHRIHPVAILPSLVEHLDSVPSVMGMPSGRGASHRVAAWFQSEAPVSPVIPAR